MTTELIPASAQPEKRLFISLITRDISLVAAILDLVDNSINAAIRSGHVKLDKSSDYLTLLTREQDENLPVISIEISPDLFKIKDTCGGIKFSTARDDIFRFGRPSSPTDAPPPNGDGDRLSVYGIGLKRAIFKVGNAVSITSEHPEGGFGMELNVRAWEASPQERWTIPISRLDGSSGPYGTEITIGEIFPDISRRVADGRFKGDLLDAIGRTYSYFLDRIVHITVDGAAVKAADLPMGDNVSSETFQVEGVEGVVLAGFSIPKGKHHDGEIAGWYVFCNGRAIAFADKSSLTGWGVDGLLPTFQPKHRPFLGLVFFSAVDPEKLPWTTTKSSINQESVVWQHATRVMASVGRQVTSVLDRRYSDDGTEISKEDLQDIAGSSVSAFASISTPARAFKTSTKKKETTSIQFSVKVSEIEEIREYLGRRTMSNGDVGRYTFDHFLENVVRDD